MQPEMQLETTAGAPAQPATPQAEPAPRWNPALLIAFRFVFSYLILYNISTFIDLIPFTDTISEKYEQVWQRLVPWIGSHVLHLAQPITIFSNGSGDTTYDYVKLLPQLVIAVVATLAWSFMDRRRTNYRVLHQWFMLLMRIALGITMISYGAVKVIKSQFPDPSLARMIQPFGDASPMGLLWTFMGASRAYNIFTGGVECLGGFLLFIPRLTTLGALVSIGALTNIFILNMSYDVPVKLFSFHLLLMAVVLAAPDLRRLAEFFLFHRQVQLSTYSPRLRRRWTRWVLVGAQVLILGYYSIISFVHSYQSFIRYNAKPPLYGIWSVDEFSVDNQVIPVSAKDPARWHRLIVDNRFEVSLQSIDGARDRYRSSYDMPGKKITLTKRDNPTLPALNLSFTNPQSDSMELEGTVDGKHLYVKLHRSPEPAFLLNTRGFHWINEYPYNH
jgi:uncharacterized membrane protein YphA (DoxX/SURF4 family)